MAKIEFNAADHSYWCDGVQLTSVTTVVKGLVRPFDRDKIAGQCARRDGVSVAQILQDWDEKGKKSMQRGTDVHTYIDETLQGKADPVLFALNDRLPEMDAFDSAWKSLQERLKARVVLQEHIVGNLELGVAGRLDAVFQMTLPSGKQQVSLVDWKTGTRFETSGRYEWLLPPFEDISQCELSQYSIQLSTYRLLLEMDDPAKEFGESYLVHLRADGKFRVYQATDYRVRVKAWLESRMAKSRAATNAQPVLSKIPFTPRWELGEETRR